MMKKVLRFALLSAVAMFSTAAMAQEADVFGAVGKGWGDEGCNRQYDLGANKTITFDFVVNQRAAENWFGWITLARSGNYSVEGAKEYFFMQPSAYAVTDGVWDDASKSTAANPGTWYKCNFNSIDFGKWPTELTGAHVVLKVSRVGSEIRYLADIRPTASDAIWGHYFVMDCGKADGDIFILFGADQAELALNSAVISDSEADPAVQGTLVGEIDNTGGISSRSADFTFAPESTLSLKFINYSCCAANWYNWIFEVQNGDKFLDLRCDNFGWGDYWNAENCTIENYDWNSFKYDMNGATVELTATRTGSTVKVEATATTTTNKVMKETYTVTHDDFATGDVTARLLAEGCHMDLLSQETTGIAAVKTVSSTKAVRYNVAGQQVGAGFKGLVIENGKKMIIK